MRVRALGLAGLLPFVASVALQAQGGRPVARAEVYAGSEVETYLRNLQVLGEVPLYPWSARRFTAAEVDRLLPRDTNHPWADRYDWRPAPRWRVSVAVVRPEVAVRVNTGFPYGYNDGMVWAGRGVTVSAQAGFVARYGPVAAAVVPEGFWAQNAGFRLVPNGQTGARRFADAQNGGIDRPQRFGDGAYKRASWGQSVLEVSALGAVAGVSTANDYWGPAASFPVILGNNAEGIPRVFVGSAAPVDLGVARVHVRSFFGMLGQSAYSPMTGNGARRAAAGGVVVVMPRWPRGVEFGASRFIHSAWEWRSSVGTELLSPFGLGVSSSAQDLSSRADSFRNNLASASFRWVLPRAGLEMYGEYGTEDYRYNVRELLVEPDHIAGYTLGLRRVERRARGALRVLRVEVQNIQAGTLVQERQGLDRPQSSFYVHGRLLQGHTSSGQILGSEWGVGGAAVKVAWETYHRDGRLSLAYSRLVRSEAAPFEVAQSRTGARTYDVLHTLTAGGLFFRGRYEVFGEGSAVYEFNRDSRRDAFNLNLVVGVRVGNR